MSPDAPSESAPSDFDAVRFFTDSTALVQQATTGESGLVGVRQVADIALWALDATGVAFVEFGPAVGRVIAAAGDGAQRARPPGRVRRSSGCGRFSPRSRSAPARSATLPEDLRIGGVRGVPVRPRDAGQPGGRRAARLSRPGQHRGSPQRSRRCATSPRCSARSTVPAADCRCTPNPPYAPPPTAPLLLDAENLVCWVDPASAAILHDTAVAMGAPLPMPVPGPGQILEA